MNSRMSSPPLARGCGSRSRTNPDSATRSPEPIERCARRASNRFKCDVRVGEYGSSVGRRGHPCGSARTAAALLCNATCRFGEAKIEEDDVKTIRKWAQSLRLRTLTTTLVLAVLAALLLAGTALAAAKPGTPTAKAPKGTITTAKPTFKWGKARGAASYELRVYKGKQLLRKKSGLKKTSWTPATALPAGVDLTWKVRARNAGGAGAWSRSLKFRTTDPAIGQSYGGGVVAYILQSGDPGYV